LLNLFVSDLHLSACRPETADRFVAFLAGPARPARALFILGDLFDYWAGDDDLAEPFNRRIGEALAGLTGAGTEVFFIPGNRDFLIGPAFAAATGIQLMDEPMVSDIGGMPTLLLHGDTLCTDDADYQAFRAMVRTQAWRDDFLARPLAERRARIEALRARSEGEKQTKSMAIMDVNDAAVAEAYRLHGVTRMIHGHTHRQNSHKLRVDGRACQRWVLGEWGAAGNALACDADGCRWLSPAP
jgi:UDP-2,3-diacylglucosamine hydrolase